MGGGITVTAGFELLGMRPHTVGDLGACVEPGCIVVGLFALQEQSDSVEFADVGPAVCRRPHHVDESGGPAIVAREIHEVRVGFCHDFLVGQVRGAERDARSVSDTRSARYLSPTVWVCLLYGPLRPTSRSQL